MQTPFRSMLLLGAVAVAALVAPASATSRGKAQYADILSNSASFYATLSPLPNTTGERGCCPRVRAAQHTG